MITTFWASKNPVSRNLSSQRVLHLICGIGKYTQAVGV